VRGILANLASGTDLIDGKLCTQTVIMILYGCGIQAPMEPIAERMEFEGEGSAEQIMALMDED